MSKRTMRQTTYNKIRTIYTTLKYNSKGRWLSYWYQISETLATNPKDVLLIGKGSGIVEYTIQLLNPEVNIVVLDINPTLKPDIVGSVLNLPFKKESFDSVLCAQVLEHISFENFEIIMRELHSVTKNNVILSVPHKRKYVKVNLKIPFLREKTIIIKFPFTKEVISSKQHHWEIGRKVSRGQVFKSLTKFFELQKEFLNEINCSHRFFVLKKRW